MHRIRIRRTRDCADAAMSWRSGAQGWPAVAIALDQPAQVVDPADRASRRAGFLPGTEGRNRDQGRLQPPDAAIARICPDDRVIA